MRWKKHLLALSPYQPGKSIKSIKEEFNLKSIVKLSSNENPFGCSKKVMDAIRQNPIPLDIYPDGHAGELREALSANLNVAPAQLIFGNGSDEIIQIISRSLLYPGANTIMAAPTFPQYRHNAILEGAEVREVPLISGKHDLEGMLALIDENTNVIWICSPNNPTGIHIPEQELLSFLERVPSEILVAIDEAYCEYVVAEDYHDTISLVKQFPNVIALRTFSKIYGLASLRIGYGIADEALIRTLEPAREPFNTSSIAQLAARAAIGDVDFVEMCRGENRKGLEKLYEFCEEHSLPYFPSQGNFILIGFKQSADRVFRHMLEKGFIIRSGTALGFPEYVRVTIGSVEQMDGLVKEFTAFLEQQSKSA